MASFFRSARDSRSRDVILRQTLTNNLSENVKAIQFNHQIEDCTHQILGSNDLSIGLCAALEAIFLHGLKDTFFKKAKSAFTGDVDQKPEPNFWPLLLILSHRENIQQINSLQNITTEIGQCRAWIRIALNECLLSSYLSTLMKNMSSSKPYYSLSAFIRDVELLDVAQRLLEGVESCTQFELPTNSSLLNSWPEDVLMLSGIWTPTMRSCPIAPGIDVASTLSTTDPENKKDYYIPGRLPIVSSLGHMLDQDEALNLILSNTPDNFMDDINKSKFNGDEPCSSNLEENDEEVTTNKENVDETTKVNEEELNDSEIINEFNEPISHADKNIFGNSILGKSTWSSDLNEEQKNSSTENLIIVSKSDMSDSSSSIVEVGAVKNSLNGSSINLREVIQGLHRELKLTADDQENSSKSDVPPITPISPDDPLLTGLGYEVVTKTASTLFEINELQKLITQVGVISREYGLDSQDYQCIGCNDMLGTTSSKAKVCGFTGQYFCTSCMDPNVFMIPARVIHNWDFHRYPVSKRAASFLLEFQHQPLINMKKINPLIYTGISEMAQLQLLRIQLNFLRAYLFTCREPVIEELQKRIWPREYLYEHVHLYSISDLAQISNGSLASQLQKIVSFAQNHVKDCWLCSQKGFICEICKNTKILYPFDIINTYRCELCSSVFHAKCLNAQKPCPKCVRKRKREGKTLVDAVHNNC